MAICLLADANMAELYWGEAVMTAAYLQNRLPSRVIPTTPFELWTERKADIRHFRVFGCEAYVHIPNVKRFKLDPKAVKLRFVGYSEDHKGYRFLDQTTNRITISRDARFLEHGYKLKQQQQDVSPGNPGQEIGISCSPMEPEAEQRSESSFEGWDDANDGLNQEDFIGFDTDVEAGEAEDEAEPDDAGEENREDRRSRGVLPRRYNDFTVGVAECSPEEPVTYRDAMKTAEWKNAMDAEMQSHFENQTWELIQLPEGKKVIGSKWIFKLKRNEICEVVKHKARLVGQGFNQRFGVDYLDVFAPVTRLATLRTVLAIAGKWQMFLHHFDIKTAYLNGTLEEEVYMRYTRRLCRPS
ncbi:copia protein isoform X2 [Wyeomyia smithii]|uniref:copia protein isoform X2 n=1 Tax=Wyeomyia smithii TaxID=174621 RepID=UPI002467BA36|nr:copia protein isoform X2 [Wyeomyia smithii]